MYNYPVAIELGDDTHSFGVIFPDIEGCFSAGDSIDEALAEAKEALEFHLEGLAEFGDLPPTPGTIEQYRGEDRFQGCVWALVQIDPTPYMGKSEKINVTLPAHLTARIDKEAARLGAKNRSQFLQLAALSLLNKRDNSKGEEGAATTAAQ